MARMGLARRDPDPVADPAAPAPAAERPAADAVEYADPAADRPSDRPADPAQWSAAPSPYAVPDPAPQAHPPSSGPPPGGPALGHGAPGAGVPGAGGYARPQTPPGGGLRPSQGRGVPAAQGPVPVGGPGQPFGAAHGGLPGGHPDGGAFNGGGTATAVRHDTVRMTDFMAGMAMRDLNLVDALLATVEELEDTADDPSLMDRLFEIDNLATRMRRHSENLLLLTDQTTVEPDEEPVSVLDVARAAISEIKDYPRVQVGRLPNGYVVGTAADDISHLLAELLDNATQHSPEHAQVVISAQPMADGGLLYIVEDEGVGLPREEVTDLNSRLTGPPRLDQRALRHMGLYVASRIAYRHGLTVQLEARAFRGVSAYAVVPATLLTDKGPRPERGKGMTASRNTPSLPPRPQQYPPARPAPPPGEAPQSAITDAGLPRRSAHRDPAKAAMLQQIAQDLAAEDNAAAAPGGRHHGRSEEGSVEDRAARIRDELGGFLEGEQAAFREKE
ncbi:ATP-binding protein [Nocardiopsis sp. RSe5-2]|uniref:histidine kinase n=1 Tax=Nocardiopsis endophytica TaxID=3018445 RepID=A0ABT4U5U9_9ACTN|nr:ATP-binding protein [Nocardiopsis endophytica]MDA2812320.1 ATP-binding protein [Nocardiopsis endophytica]